MASFLPTKELTTEQTEDFNKLKQQAKYDYIIIQVDIKGQIQFVEKKTRTKGVEADPVEAHNKFLDHLDTNYETKPCFILYDFHHTYNKMAKSTLLFLCWVPDKADGKTKMMSASSRENVKSKFEGIATIQADTRSDITYEEILATKHIRTS